MTKEELLQLLSQEEESTRLEFKSGFSLNDKRKCFLKTVQTMLALANTKDGGTILIGRDQSKAEPLQGLSEDEFKTWNKDDLSSKLFWYSDPTFSFEILKRVHEEKRFVVVKVHEFEDIPIVCRADANLSEGKKQETILRRGACYVRTRKPETVEVCSQESMRQLIEMATAKQLSKHVHMLEMAGLIARISPSVIVKEPSEVEKYEAQLRQIGFK